ncbi:MAG: amidohydrolase [Chloroflexi bacterium]|nr:amidohydrolase [Chloroflexota bacterium]
MPDFLTEAQALFDYTQSLRRDFHRHPELGFQEVRTAGIVAKELSSLGLEITTGVAETGVVAVLDGGKPGPVVLLRFDMDALPIAEETGAEYASQNEGVMHACGHDGHTAIGLTVARLLHRHRGELSGTVKLIFQPAEEGVVGQKGMGGAEQMMDEGVLEAPNVDYALSLHLWNEKPLGWLGIAAGPVMAGAEYFKIVVRGKGGHGAVPHASLDPIVAASHIVTALQSIVSRNVAPLETAVVTVGSIRGGEAFNVIPPEVAMTGTIRTFEPGVRKTVLERFEQIVHGTAEALGCSAEIELKRISPAVVNDTSLAAIVQAAAQTVFPETAIDTANYVTMGAEDMAFIMEKVPGCYFFIGSANAEKGLDYGHHHPKFDIDEAALPRAAALMAQAALEVLKG